MKKRLRRCLATLELGPEATFTDVVSARNELEQVWHPDRFVGDPGLQTRSATKLAEIRDAFAYLEANQCRLRGRSASSPSIPTAVRSGAPSSFAQVGPPGAPRMLVALAVVAALGVAYLGLGQRSTTRREEPGRSEAVAESDGPEAAPGGDQAAASAAPESGRPASPPRSTKPSTSRRETASAARTIRLADGRTLQVEGIRRDGEQVTLLLAENVQLVVNAASIVNWHDLGSEATRARSLAPSSIIVQFDDGRTLEVAGVERSGDVARIHLEGGGSLAVQASRISNWEDIERQTGGTR